MSESLSRGREHPAPALLCSRSLDPTVLAVSLHSCSHVSIWLLCCSWRIQQVLGRNQWPSSSMVGSVCQKLLCWVGSSSFQDAFRGNNSWKNQRSAGCSLPLCPLISPMPTDPLPLTGSFCLCAVSSVCRVWPCDEDCTHADSRAGSRQA